MKNNFSKSEQKAMKKVFGWGYAKTILKYFNKRGFLNADSVPYSDESIRAMFTKHTTNKLHVKEIEKLYKRLKVKQEKEKEERKELFKN